MKAAEYCYLLGNCKLKWQWDFTTHILESLKLKKTLYQVLEKIWKD